MAHAHDKRFEPFNHFPANVSDNKPVKQVDFDLMLDRDDVIYKST